MALSHTLPARPARRRALGWSLGLGLPAAALLAAAVLAGQEFRLFERAWFNVQQWYGAETLRRDALWLPDYRVVVEARPLAGLDDLSGLTFDASRGTLFSITNARPEVIELSTDGEVLRRIPLAGFGDPEAIEYLSPGRFVITDERDQRLVVVRIDERTTQLDAAHAEQLSLGLGLNGNKGFEGLAYDARTQRLFVAKERDPLRIYEIAGFPHGNPGKPMAVRLRDDPERDARLFVRDLSSLSFDTQRGHLLALSDESRLLLELDIDGRPLSSLSLLAGRHGLRETVPQAEGVTTDDAGNLYIISEPNLFYVFRKAP